MKKKNIPIFGAEITEVLDKDTRAVVDNPLMVPYCGICAVRAYSDTTKSSFKYGTGWLIGPQTVVTAAHVIYDPRDSGKGFGDDHDGFCALAGVAFGLASHKFADADFALETNAWTVWEPYLNSKTKGDDIAVIHLPEPVPSSFEFFSFEQIADTAVVNSQVRIAGYPKKMRNKALNGEVLVEASGLVNNAEVDRFIHSVDTTSGQSGAPLWRDDVSGAIVLGQQVKGFGAILAKNTAVRIDADKHHWLLQQINTFS